LPNNNFMPKNLQQNQPFESAFEAKSKIPPKNIYYDKEKLYDDNI